MARSIRYVSKIPKLQVLHVYMYQLLICWVVLYSYYHYFQLINTLSLQQSFLYRLIFQMDMANILTIELGCHLIYWINIPMNDLVSSIFLLFFNWTFSLQKISIAIINYLISITLNLSIIEDNETYMRILTNSSATINTGNEIYHYFDVP